MMQKLLGKFVVLKMTGVREAETCPWRVRDLRRLHGGDFDFGSSVHETSWAYVLTPFTRLRWESADNHNVGCTILVQIYNLFERSKILRVVPARVELS